MIIYDVIIIGAGPAGLSAALTLGRSRRKVLVCDSGKPRNIKAKSMHGFLTRDGISPGEFLRIGREEVLKYGVKFFDTQITKVLKEENHFKIINDKSEEFISKKILIATGIKDTLPPVKNIEEFYGKSVFHCPYCDGWEVRDKKLAVYGKGKSAYLLAYSLKTWSDKIAVCTDGKTRMPHDQKEKLLSDGIEIYNEKVENLTGENGYLKEIIFSDGTTLKCDAIFFSAPKIQHSDFANQLGCTVTKDYYIKFDKKQQTSIKGVFTSGDCSKDMKFVIVAAAEGIKAAVAINTELQEEERKQVHE